MDISGLLNGPSRVPGAGAGAGAGIIAGDQHDNDATRGVDSQQVEDTDTASPAAPVIQQPATPAPRAKSSQTGTTAQSSPAKRGGNKKKPKGQTLIDQPEGSSTNPLPAATLTATPSAEPTATDEPDWVDNIETIRGEYSTHLVPNKDLVEPYLHHYRSFLVPRSNNHSLADFSKSTTKHLLGSANHTTQWAGIALNRLMEDEVLKESRAKAAEEQQEREEAVRLEYIKRQEAEQQEKLERKKEAAREGWKKRRVNAESREKLDSERRRLANLGMQKKRAERKAYLEQERQKRAANSQAQGGGVDPSSSSVGQPDSGSEDDLDQDLLDDDDDDDDEGMDRDELDESEDRVDPLNRPRSSRRASTSTVHPIDPTPNPDPSLLHPPSAANPVSPTSNTTASSSSLALALGLSPEANAVNPIIVNGNGSGSRNGNGSLDRNRSPSIPGSLTSKGSRKRAASNPSHTPTNKRVKTTSLLVNSVKAEEIEDSLNYENSLGPASPAPSTIQPSSPAPLSYQDSPYDGDDTLKPKKGNLHPGQVHGQRLASSPAPSLSGPGPAKTSLSAIDHERKVWATLARSVIPKVIKVQQQGLTSRQIFHRRLSAAVARESKKYNTRPNKPVKDIQTKARRVMREMLLNLKGSEKLIRENKKKAEKEQMEKVKREEEVREAQRAARKLNFLITQTELYSHFVGSKLKTSEMEESEETAGTSTAGKNGAPDLAPESSTTKSMALTAAHGGMASNQAGDLQDINFDDADETNMLSHAARNAQAAIQTAQNKAKQFDATYQSEQANSKENYNLEAMERQLENGGDAAMNALTDAEMDKDLNKINIDEMNFQNPTMAGDVNILKQPTMLTCLLKEYQLKGLNWLANLYEQGINGILADEMGLGKTVQSISLMAYLAETHNIWGPFLVVAPASTLHNWQQEISRFTPALKVLPYWGNVKDRATLRKFWNRKSMRYDRNAPFHVLVTSYQLVVTDEQYFQKVKWQYMVLDEAQAIKSSASARWKTLLGFNCRNRLLLTGTPIQNSMQELWALLHFIMPSLFDSHNEFSEWFSRDIEGNADKNGAMNAHQLRRLHMILKPFMLRRIKKNVQNELADKIEIDVYCDLTPRQKHMYRTLRKNISIADLVARASSLNDDDSVKRLMNLIMQFRKVCNHPELFERADVTAPFAFCDYNQSYNLSREGNNLAVQYSTNSYLDVELPKLFYDDPPAPAVRDTTHLAHLMDIWSAGYIAESLETQSSFAFAKLIGSEPRDLSILARSSDPLERIAVAEKAYYRDSILAAQKSISETSFNTPSIRIPSRIPDDPQWHYMGLPPLSSIQSEDRDFSRLNRSDTHFYVDPAVAPPPSLYCSSRAFTYKQQDALYDLSTRTALYGVPNETPGVLGSLHKAQLPLAPMEVPQLHKLILDSGKLAKLDELLVTLKAGGHRVLVYFQMTRMIDLMEEYLAFRQYKYLRLDGSSSISERRDMVSDWQSKPEIFIFLLSTRAGGLGINLTAADTVIFYDSDWNPSNDSQAMDRAHRLGQTRQVTVYRLITKGTIDERILALARNKKNVQDAVVGSSTQTVSSGDGVKGTEVVSLLLDDDELAETLKQSEAKRQKQEMKAIDNGKRGAKAREDNKRAREIAAAAKAAERSSKGGSGLGGSAAGNGWGAEDDDDDAFGFFSNTTAKPAKDPDDETGLEDGDESTVKPAAKGKAKAKARKAKADPDDPDAPPKKKRAPAKKKEVELGPDGLPVAKPKPKAKPKKSELNSGLGVPSVLASAASTVATTTPAESSTPSGLD